MFVMGFAIAGLNFRFQWIVLPDWVMWAAAIIFIFSYLLYAEVLRENTYLSRTVEVQNGQKVIDTGLYAIVRHPMYTATIILFLSMPVRRHIVGGTNRTLISALLPPRLRSRVGDRKLSAGQPHAVVALFEKQESCFSNKAMTGVTAFVNAL